MAALDGQVTNSSSAGQGGSSPPPLCVDHSNGRGQTRFICAWRSRQQEYLRGQIMQTATEPRAMAAAIERDVDHILDRHWLLVGGRLAITFMYWFAGIGFALNFPAAVAMIRS